jgi:tetratricopeptide (TPR) repeat protein
MGSPIDAAKTRIALAELLVDAGHPRNAESAVIEAREIIRKQKLTEEEAWADAVLARALSAQGKMTEAAREIDAAAPLAEKIRNEEVNLKFATAAGSVHAGSAKLQDRAIAVRNLEATLAKATKLGLVPYEYEARLALGDTEIKTGRTSLGRSHLMALEKAARQRGFLLIARKAAMVAKSSKENEQGK